MSVYKFYFHLLILLGLIAKHNNSLLILIPMTTSLLHSQLKRSCFLSLLIRLPVCQTQASILGILITFVNIFHLNLVVMFVCFTLYLK
jgi:hypothetical protein